MYTEFFGLNEKPFSITPDPRYLYLSRRHADALAHLIYGISESGGFIQLTGEVGTGKTTLIRSVLEQLPEKAEVALILNPQLTSKEFLENICEELGTPRPADGSARALITALNDHLLKAHAEGRRTVLIVDEAQTLSPELLEQVRLLTNLETPTQKLLQIILIGQPELRDLLARPEMRQLAQRITGRYHLEPLSKTETAAYVRHRMRVAGCQAPVFTGPAIAELYRRSDGIPRLINVVADRALLAAYTLDRARVDRTLVRKAAAEVFGRRRPIVIWPWAIAATGAAAIAFGTADLWRESRQGSRPVSPALATAPADEPSSSDRADGLLTSAEMRAELEPAALPAERRASLDELLVHGGFPTDTDSAFEQLFALWDAEYDPERGEPCRQAEAQRLKCLFQSRGSIGRLRTLNRPAILTLVGGDGRMHEVVMSSLGYGEAELLAGGREVKVSLSELTHHWFGDHLLLWRPPTGVNKDLAAGMTGAEVLWLRESLARVRGEAPPDSPSPRFDAALEASVREYQRDRLLSVDGIVGAMTQLALTTDLGAPAVPTLRKSR